MISCKTIVKALICGCIAQLRFSNLWIAQACHPSLRRLKGEVKHATVGQACACCFIKYSNLCHEFAPLKPIASFVLLFSELAQILNQNIVNMGESAGTRLSNAEQTVACYICQSNLLQHDLKRIASNLIGEVEVLTIVSRKLGCLWNARNAMQLEHQEVRWFITIW